MDPRFDGIWFLFFLQILSSVVSYIRFYKNGSIISKHSFSKYPLHEILTALFLILGLLIYESGYLKVGFLGTVVVAVYMIVFLLVCNQDIILNKSGFIYSGKYTKWDDVEEIIIEENSNLIICKVGMIKTKVVIRSIDNRELFISIADRFKVKKP